VADLATWAVTVPPSAKITSTRRLTRSAASKGKRSSSRFTIGAVTNHQQSFNMPSLRDITREFVAQLGVAIVRPAIAT
jgi:hypothetical protein